MTVYRRRASFAAPTLAVCLIAPWILACNRPAEPVSPARNPWLQKDEALCEPGAPRFKRQHASADGTVYYTCDNEERDVEVAASVQRRKGISYLVVFVAWALTDKAEPLPVRPASVSMQYRARDGRMTTLERVDAIVPEASSFEEVMAAQDLGVRSTTIEPGGHHSGLLYFQDVPDAVDGVSGQYIVHVGARRMLVAFEVPGRNVQVPK